MTNESQLLSEQALECIKNIIVEKGMNPGDKLPSERELAELFNMSRAPVREALKILEYAGILYRKGGYGLYVREVSTADIFSKINFALATTSKTINELMEFRISLEADAAYFAALRRNSKDLLTMEKTIETMRKIQQADKSDLLIEQFQQESTNFHVAIIQATENSVLQGVYNHLLSLLKLSRQYMTARIAANRNPITDHEAIFKKILEQDAEGARVYMKKHLIDAKDAYNTIINGIED
jgi:GntR family transcriptional repressor for pyruvate dehydrogenase complex